MRKLERMRVRAKENLPHTHKRIKHTHTHATRAQENLIATALAHFLVGAAAACVRLLLLWFAKFR